MKNQNDELHTVLGANGAMGKALADELKKRKLHYKLVSSNSSQDKQTIEKADLTNKEETLQAIKESRYVYLCVGLPYSTKIWTEQWPIIMQNVIAACAVHNSKLIFFDNVYSYSQPLSIPFDEKMSQKPTTKKGELRKYIADVMLNAVAEKRIDGLIARSADFYGPNAKNSILYISILKKMLQGKKPQSLSNGNIAHTYAYLADNAKAILELSLRNDCYGEIWHLPVSNLTTLDQVVKIFNQVLKKEYKLQVMPKFMINILSRFIPMIKEVKEMQYQFDNEYKMSHQKFMTQFPDFEITPIEKGLTEMANYFKNAVRD